MRLHAALTPTTNAHIKLLKSRTTTPSRQAERCAKQLQTSLKFIVYKKHRKQKYCINECCRCIVCTDRHIYRTEKVNYVIIIVQFLCSKAVLIVEG